MWGNEKTAASETIIPPTTAFLYDAIADCQVSDIYSITQLSHQPMGSVETTEWIGQRPWIDNRRSPGYRFVCDRHNGRLENDQYYPYSTASCTFSRSSSGIVITTSPKSTSYAMTK